MRPISVLSETILRGCNTRHTSTVICLRLDLGDAGRDDVGQLGACLVEPFRERFLKLPRLIHEPVRTQEFCSRLQSAEPSNAPHMAEILLEAIVAVENAIAARMHRLDLVEYAAASGSQGDVELCWSTQSASLSRQSAEVAIAGLNELVRMALGERSGPPASRFEALLAELERVAVSRRLTTTVSVIREAAKARGIPCAYVGGSYLRLGQGKFQTHFRGSVTGKTSHAASQLSIDKRLATKTLRTQRLPVPKQVRVVNVEKAVSAAGDLGYPVVVKPMKGHGGAGVSIVRTEPEIHSSYQLARTLGREVVVEEFIEGSSYRLLVMDNKVVAALKIAAPVVTGDGVRKIKDLVEELNLDPFRDGFRLLKIEIDDRLIKHLQEYGATIATVLEPGRTLTLRAIANVSQGGYSIDVTDEVHPDNAEIAVRAARAIGLDVAGIDFLTPDIALSHKEIGGAIIEINGRPGFGMHYWPRHGAQRDVGGAALDLMYSAGIRATVASAVVVGDRRTAVVARDLDGLLREMSQSVGLTIKGRAFVNGNRRDINGRKAARSLRTLLLDPEVDSLVATMSPTNIVDSGLNLNAVQTAALSDPAAGTDMSIYERALDVLLRARPTRLVIGATNPLIATSIERQGAAGVALVSRTGTTRQVRKHLRAGGHAVVAMWIDGRRYVEVYESGQMIASLPVSGSPMAEIGPASGHEVAVGSTGPRSLRIEPRLFAVAMAVAFGCSIERIAEALARAPLSFK